MKHIALAPSFALALILTACTVDESTGTVEQSAVRPSDLHYQVIGMPGSFPGAGITRNVWAACDPGDEVTGGGCMVDGLTWTGSVPTQSGGNWGWVCYGQDNQAGSMVAYAGCVRE